MSDPDAVCEQFRHDFPAYLVKVLIPSRRVSLEEHLGRCPNCRQRIAELRGKRPDSGMRVRSASRWVRLGTLAAVASLLIAIAYAARDTIDVMMAPGGPRATVVSTDGGLFRVAAGSVKKGAAIGERDSIRTGPGARAVLQLADGSKVDLNERTELFVTAAWSGQTIHLERGDIIVNAAKQPRGSLRVLTRDSITSVRGTIFAVSAGLGGSLVSAIEGSVAVNQRGKELVLAPGNRAASIPALASSGVQAVSWSPDSQGYVFLERRAPAGAEENEVTFAVQGPRTGMASWLADAGSVGAAEYLPADALVAGYVSMREPLQMFEELTLQMTRSEPEFVSRLSSLKEKLGAGFVQNLAAAVGTEAALALTGFSASDPLWMMVTLANNPAVIDRSLQKLVETFNAELGPDEQFKRIVFEQQTAGGRTWNRVITETLPLGITWTYDAGYMVAGTDRAVAELAIATRNGGIPLVRSSDFLGQLPSSAGLHPSAFAWLNTKGVATLPPLAPTAALGELMARRDSMLVVFEGSSDQIRAVSRTRIFGLIVDLMLMENLGRVIQGQPGAR